MARVLLLVVLSGIVAAGQTPFEAWNYLDAQHRVGERTWLHATAKLKWHNNGPPAWFYYGGEVGIQRELLPRLRGGVNYILLRDTRGTRFYRDQRVDFDGEALLPRGLRDRVRYEYRWFRLGNSGVWRDRLLWMCPDVRRAVRPEASFEFYYDPGLSRPTDQRYTLGFTLTRLRFPLEVGYAYDRFFLGGGWQHRNLLLTYLHLTR
ncbi:MAG: hypothetical protein ACYC6M_07215 [Terriglobales bacterium]